MINISFSVSKIARRAKTELISVSTHGKSTLFICFRALFCTSLHQ